MSKILSLTRIFENMHTFCRGTRVNLFWPKGAICIVEITMGIRYLPPNPPVGAKSLHIHYNSTIQVVRFNVSWVIIHAKVWGGVSLAVTIRKYIPAQDPILPNETVVYIRGALHAPTNDLALIDCNQTFVTCPGKPTDDGYQDRVCGTYKYGISKTPS